MHSFTFTGFSVPIMHTTEMAGLLNGTYCIVNILAHSEIGQVPEPSYKSFRVKDENCPSNSASCGIKLYNYTIVFC
jgi:hypothetical protein